jgi:outer membrane protein OmpA-like peptidoglycan-associated protein
MLRGQGPCAEPSPQRPPILNLTEREGFRFATGSYVISEQFMAKLRTVIAPAILKLGAEYHARVVEVVGHTDSVPMLSAQPSPDRKLPLSSLDRKLNAYLSGDKIVSGDKTLSGDKGDKTVLGDKTLSGEKAGVEVVDNVGLGMMRAASVVRALKELPELQRSDFAFLAMSAGQTIGPDDRPIAPESGPPAGDEKRRRVEIRLRRSLHEP